MRDNLVSAVFDSQAEAQAAVAQLRSAGVSDSAISIIARQDGKATETDGAGDAVTDVVGKTALGAGVGTLLGIAALAIPGVGPLVAAGAIASSAIPGAALTGAAIGAAAGGLAGLLSDHGVDAADAEYYSDRVNNGGVFVSVDTGEAGVSTSAARDILYSSGGHSSSQPRAIVGDDPNRGPFDRAANALDGTDDPNRGPLDRAENALSGTDDPNRGPFDRAENALRGTDDPNRGPFDRAANAIDGTDDPNRGPIDRAANAIDGTDDPNRGPIDRTQNALDRTF